MNIDKYLSLQYKEYDCYDLASLIYEEELGKPLPSFDYNVNDANSIAKKIGEGKPLFKKIDKPVKYAIILLKTEFSSRHIGVMIDERRFIHMIRDASPIISSIRDNEYAGNILGFYQY